MIHAFDKQFVKLSTEWYNLVIPFATHTRQERIPVID